MGSRRHPGEKPMKLVGEHIVTGKKLPAFQKAFSEIENAILKTPLVINPTRKGNGVKPIKLGVIKSLEASGWTDEHCMELELMRRKPLDAYKKFGKTRVGFEWETGNISSSFRALMKLIKGLVEDQIDLGVHVVPSRALYEFLTDRVGNITELLPYLTVFGSIKLRDDQALVIMVVEHDKESKSAKLIPKGNDGMSLSRRARL